MTATKELIDLLREARHELDSSHYINNRLSPLAQRIDAALAAHEAEPEQPEARTEFWGQCDCGKQYRWHGTEPSMKGESERKCGTCEYFRLGIFAYPPKCSHLKRDIGSADWFCADWQSKEKP